jgi:hypothetical protein
MALVVKRLSYSRKVAVLLPLAKEYLRLDVTDKFKRLFDIYVNLESGMEFLTV